MNIFNKLICRWYCMSLFVLKIPVNTNQPTWMMYEEALWHCSIFFNLHFNMIFNTLFDTCRMTSLSTLKLSCWKLRASPTNMATNALKISKSNYAEPFNTPNMWKTMYHRPAQEQLLSKTLHPRINGRTQRLTGLVLVLGHCGTSEACDAGVLHRRARY